MKKKIIIVLTILFFISTILLSYLNYSLLRKVRIKSKEVEALDHTLSIKDDILTVLHAKHLEVINLFGQDVNPSGYGKIIWDTSDNSAVLQVANLMPANSSEDYQLWLVKGDTSISEGVFQIRKSDSENFFKIHKLLVNNLNELDSIILTLERKGGTSNPDGIIYLLGNPSSQ